MLTQHAFDHHQGVVEQLLMPVRGGDEGEDVPHRRGHGGGADAIDDTLLEQGVHVVVAQHRDGA